MSDLESLVPKHFGALTTAEALLLRKAGDGELAVCGPNEDLNSNHNDPTLAEDWGADRSVRAELIVWLCADRKAKNLVGPGGIQILGARISGSIALLSVRIEFPLLFACCHIDEEINLQSAQTRTLSFTQTHFASIYADGAVVEGALFLRNCCSGQIHFTGARIDGQLDLSDSTFEKFILDGGAVRVGALLRGTKGQVKMSRARIGTDLDCAGAKLSAAPSFSAPALDAGGVTVEGSIFLRDGFQSFGSVNLHGAQLGSNLDCKGAQFRGQPNTLRGSGDALIADLIAVRGTVVLSNGFRANGRVHFTSAQIGGDFDCTSASFETGLTMERADIKGEFFWRNITLADTARLNLINTRIDTMGDDVASWPSHRHLEIHGFTYERISKLSPRDAKERLEWLARQESFTSQPYRQLASVLKSEEDEEGARQVLATMERLRRARAHGLARVWNFALRIFAGYGYYPLRALIWFVGLVALGALLYTSGFYSGSMVPTDKDAYECFTVKHSLPDHYERFHALTYSLENSLSLFKLGQVDRWQPDPVTRLFGGQAGLTDDCFIHEVLSPSFMRLFRWLQVPLGWFFATMWIAGVTGLIRKE